jgi:hypothetical protein
MFTEEQQDDLLRLVKAATEQLGTAKEKLAQADQKLQTNTELLKQSTEDIHVLLAFIKSRGLQPPKIQSKFIN